MPLVLLITWLYFTSLHLLLRYVITPLTKLLRSSGTIYEIWELSPTNLTLPYHSHSLKPNSLSAQSYLFSKPILSQNIDLGTLLHWSLECQYLNVRSIDTYKISHDVPMNSEILRITVIKEVHQKGCGWDHWGPAQRSDGCFYIGCLSDLDFAAVYLADTLLSLLSSREQLVVIMHYVYLWH